MKELEVAASQMAQGYHVDVGIFDPVIARYMLINEFGGGKIPSRPWLRAMFDARRSVYEEWVETAVLRIMLDGADPRTELGDIAQRVEEDFRRSIREWAAPPNAPMTVSKKGFNDPLVETGAAQQAVTHRFGGRLG